MSMTGTDAECGLPRLLGRVWAARARDPKLPYPPPPPPNESGRGAEPVGALGRTARRLKAGFAAALLLTFVATLAPQDAQAQAQAPVLTATPGDGQVTLSWTVSSTGVGTKWGYKINGGGFTWAGTPIAIPGSNARTRSHMVTGLTNGTSYQFIVYLQTATNTAYRQSGQVSATPNPPTAGVTLSRTSLTVEEGSSETYTVKLDKVPSANVTVTVGGASGDVTVTGSSLTFTPGNFGTAQTVTVSAARDGDTTDDTATLTHTASSTDTAYGASLAIDDVDVTVTDTTPTFQLLTDPAAVAEGTDISLTVTSDRSISGNWPVRLTLAARSSSGFTAADIAGTLGPREFTANFGSTTASTTGTVTIPTGTDSATEGAEAYRITLGERISNVTYAVGTDNTADGTLNDGTTASVPAAPTGLSAEAGNRQVKLTWTDPDDDSITRYNMRQKRGSAAWGRWTAIPGSDADTTTHTVTGLDNDVEYRFRIRARNSGGNGAQSAVVEATPSASAAVPKPVLSAAAAGYGRVTLGWSALSGVTVASWGYQYKPAGGGWSGTRTVTGGSATGTTVTGLTIGTEYTFRLFAAVSPGVQSVWSDHVRATPTNTVPKPVLTAAGGDASVTLGWSGLTGIPITSWGYQYKSTGGWSTTATLTGGSRTSVRVTGLTGGTDYTFRLFAAVRPGVQSSWSDEVTAKTDPLAPVLTAATSTTNGQIDLTWTHAGGSNELSDADDYVKDAAKFHWWRAQTRLKGETVWTDQGLNQASARQNPGSRSNRLLLNYPDGASVEVRVRATGYRMAGVAGGTGNLQGPWSNVRTVIFQDTGAPALTIAGAPVTVAPGSTATYTVALTKAYAGTLRVTSDATAAARVSPSSLAFTAANYSTARTVTVTGVANGTAVINHAFRLTGATADAIPDAGTVDVTVADTPGVTVSTAALTVAEGGSGTYTMRLNTPPTSDVTITVGGASGDVTVTGSPLTFTRTDWNMPQTVTVNAGTDTDMDTDPAVTLTHSASGGGYGSVGIADVVVGVAERDAVPLKPAGLAAAAGDGSVTLGWTDPDNPTITKWQVRRKAGGGEWGEWEDIAGSDDETASHEVSGLDNGTAYSFGVRAVNGAGNGAASDAVTATPAAPAPPAAAGRVTVTPGALTVEEGGSATYTVVLDTAPTGTVTVTVGGASGDVTVSPERLAFTPAGHAAPRTVTVRAALDADTETDPAVTLTHSASGGGYGSVSVGSVVVTVTETTRVRQARRANRVHAAVLPHVAAATVSRTLGAVTERIAAAASGASGSGPALRLGALPAAAGGRVFPPSGGRPLPVGAARPGPTLAEVLDGASLTLAPGGAAAGASPAVWARGGRVSLSGSGGGVSWDGGLWSAQFGADMRVRPDLLAGLAVSHAESRVDAATAGDGGVRVESVHETTVTSVNPYVAWLSPDGASLWASVGHGRGGVRVAEAGAPPRRAGLTQWSAAAGGRAVLAERPGGGGVTRLAVRGEGSVSRLRTGAGGGLAALAVDTARLRVALEGAHERALGDGATLTPAVELGVRYDGGDLGRDFGAEAGASLAWRDPAAGLTAELRARALAAHGRDRDEWGVGALLRLDPGADGRGTFLSLGPSHGRTESGLGRLFDRGPVAAAGTGTAGARQAEGRLEAEVGHGFGLPGPGPLAVLTPWAGLDLAETGARTLRLGARYRVGQALALGMEATHRPGPAAGQTLTLRATLRW